MLKNKSIIMADSKKILLSLWAKYNEEQKNNKEKPITLRAGFLSLVVFEAIEQEQKIAYNKAIDDAADKIGYGLHNRARMSILDLKK